VGAAVGQSLPIAVGVLISPLPIVAVVLMLLSRSARANASAFVLGWLLSIGIVVGVVATLAGAGTSESDETPTWAAVLKLVLGVLLLLVAARQWRGRPRDGVEPPAPKWMQAIDTFTPVRAFGLAVLLSAVNPKNLLLVISGGVAIASATPDPDSIWVSALVFAVVASLGVAAPLVLYLVMGRRAARLLEELKTWMVRDNAIIMAVLLTVIAAKLIGDAITAL
jgi:threonine/homoserine/homoserine lactone efflux protein